jgi:hypothetical protein
VGNYFRRHGLDRRFGEREMKGNQP